MTKRCWWKEAVVYQVYPRSFADSNGDGIGDLQGLIGKLGYLSYLGVTAIWLSPIYQSPMHDFGYDISDYRAIDPVFGTIDDVDHLIREAHARSIAIIFDMVLNHTSIDHGWFTESRSSVDSPKRDFYIWRRPSDHKYPNNWYGAFGGRAWTRDPTTGYQYLHSFLVEQPDLNWRNEEMVKALFHDMAFWFDRGVDGFRLDVINLIIKDAKLRNNPIGWGGRPRPYDLQRHLHDRNQPEAHAVLKRFRSWVDTYENKMLVGEIMVEKPGEPEMAASYQGNGDDELHEAFDFTFTWLPWNRRLWERSARRWYAALGEHRWPSWVLSNHDVARAWSRYGHSSGRAKIAACFLLTQRGTPFLYYGEELGLPEAPVSRSRIQDPLGKRYWPFHRGRDGSRRPMPWDDSEHRGFSLTAPWLPSYEPSIPSVKRCMQDPLSLLHVYRTLIALRTEDEVFRDGLIRWVSYGRSSPIMAYIRYREQEERVILLNFSSRTKKLDFTPIFQHLHHQRLQILFCTPNCTHQIITATDAPNTLIGYQVIICSGVTA